MSIKSFQELPLTMTVEEMGKLLKISRKVAYNLARRRDFTPSVRVGEKRLVIVRDKLIEWLNHNDGKIR